MSGFSERRVDGNDCYLSLSYLRLRCRGAGGGLDSWPNLVGAVRVESLPEASSCEKGAGSHDRSRKDLVNQCVDWLVRIA